ncbi:hypothetical protein GIB67_006798 [Kingdonia uniflora]|uniref:Uncharacterized protein n=1 Tax=Kingdonia uniflora TaxID=39325 RepID=A0A7J7KZW5_9MAGN|nr:hypothetical protein GIB67_006798 [Kingdonia uniflora]
MKRLADGPSKDDWYVVIDAPQRLTKDIDAYEDPLVFEARTPASTVTSTLLNDLIDEDEKITEETWGMSISLGRRSMSSDQMEDSSNLAPQRASTSPGLLRKRKALTLKEVREAVALQNEYEPPLTAKDQVLIGANIAWKNKKCELMKVYDMYPTDDTRKRNCPARTIQEDWERFADLSYDPMVVAMRARNKRSEDPKTARTDYFLASHTYSD